MLTDYFLYSDVVMIATTQRHLVNIDILLSDIEMQESGFYAGAEHQKYLNDLLRELSALEGMIELETVHSFQQAVSSAGLENVFKDKRLVSIYQKLISNVLAYWHTVNKIDDILASRFDSHSEKRLELLQAKASRAKSVFKTVAMAMGKNDYSQFITLLGLKHADWAWRE
ncbi:hypothetical protein J3369_08785 [Alteromonas sp. NFXS44]|uniref:hypothetical protein n=1 Tax=Alteromonas sp. NFXS44 TaxID=2818435 RepID=UPI0032DFD261